MEASQAPQASQITDSTSTDGFAQEGWELFWIKFAYFPWGLLILLVLIVLLATNAVESTEIGAVATAAGLLGLGRGIHTASKDLRRHGTG
jgi:hypothetical protein